MHYKDDYDKILRKIMASPDFAHPTNRSVLSEHQAGMSTSGPAITGRRSGLKINLKSGLAAMLHLDDSEHCDNMNNHSLKSEPHVEKRNIYLAHSERIPADEELSPGTVLVNSIVNLNDFNTPIKDEVVFFKSDVSQSSQIVPPNDYSEEYTVQNDSSKDEMDQKTQNLFLLSEVKMIFR
jgi:hypothetical protein